MKVLQMEGHRAVVVRLNEKEVNLLAMGLSCFPGGDPGDDEIAARLERRLERIAQDMVDAALSAGTAGGAVPLAHSL